MNKHFSIINKFNEIDHRLAKLIEIRSNKLLNYGTSEGAIAGWDVRGRGQKEESNSIINTPDNLIAVVHFTDKENFRPEDIQPGGMEEHGTFFYPMPDTDEEFEQFEEDWKGREPVFMLIPASSVGIEQTFEKGEAGNEFAFHELFAPSEKLTDVKIISKEHAFNRAQKEHPKWYDETSEG